MNSSSYCANCRLHGWKQLEDKSQLQRCKNCKVVEYCGKDCQKEHWKKVHKEQCEHFVNSGNNQDWGHKEADCLICRQVAAVGKSKLKKPNNPNYECIYKEYNFPPSSCHPRPFPITGQCLPDLYHPHPFPLTGQPGDTLEKAVIVLWQLLHKFVIVHPGLHGKKEMENMFTSFMDIRFSIWETRKVFPHPENIDLDNDAFMDFNDAFMDFKAVIELVTKSELLVDAFQLWKIVCHVQWMLWQLARFSKGLKTLQDPVSSLPDELKPLLAQGLANRDKFLSVADQILDALATRVIPYEDVLKIICGGSLNRVCSFCLDEIVVDGVADFVGVGGSPVVFFNQLSMGTYSCGRRYYCIGKGINLKEDWDRFIYAIMALVKERDGFRCDFCFQLPDKNDVHRCADCLTTMYCTKTCQNQDWKIHQIYCSKGVDERKRKLGGSARRKEGREVLHTLVEAINISEKGENAPPSYVKEVVGKIKMKNEKKSK